MTPDPISGRLLASRRADGVRHLHPEKLTDEHRLMAQTTSEFVESEVLPNLDRLEQKDWQLARR